MKNVNKKVISLTAICTLIYFVASVIFTAFNLSWEPFDKVNLISELIKSDGKKSTASAELKKKKDSLIASQNGKSEAKENFELYRKGNLITDFRESSSPALPSFAEKLHRLKKGEKVKIRIAYFGDSMIEGDLMTQTLRALLQGEYGGSGVGFLPINSNVAGFRQSATISVKGWQGTNFMDKAAQNLYISGYKYTGTGAGSYTDNTIKDSANTEKALIFGSGAASEVLVNGAAVQLSSTEKLNRKVLLKDSSNRIKISGNNVQTPLYGISFESESGVFVDNFSFRGITGVELNKIDEDFMRSVQKNNRYDLIVLQYGVNLLFKPKTTDYSFYSKMFSPVLSKMKTAFEGAEFLLISSADRAFKYNGEFKTAIGLPNLIETQALMAFENKIAFYNQFETMGGENSIVKWANEKPALANKDYIHPNHKGAEILAQRLFEAIQKDVAKKK